MSNVLLALFKKARSIGKYWIGLESDPKPKSHDFSFWDAVHRHEGHLIRMALKETGGKVTAAARILGFRHHQSLITLIASRHKELIETGARVPIRKRRHHLLEHPKRKPKKQ